MLSEDEDYISLSSKVLIPILWFKNLGRKGPKPPVGYFSLPSFIILSIFTIISAAPYTVAAGPIAKPTA